MADITVTQVRSGIGAKPKHRGTLRALGLGRIGKTNTLPDRPEIRGMIAKVPHLVTVIEDETPSGVTTTKAARKRSAGARGLTRAEDGEASASAKERP
jgi:large subunit ribosomal protein L30